MAQCKRCGETDQALLSPSKPGWCKECLRQYRQSKNARPAGATTVRANHQATATAIRRTTGAFVPDPALVRKWAAAVAILDMPQVDGTPQAPPNFLFTGPSGSGKTEAARHLAESSDMAFTKVDASAMTDPEAWFGTREVVVENGAPKTQYRPSAFVEAIQRPGVVLIDEVNRVRDEGRNILLPLLDFTGQATNPLTGEPVVRDARCIVVMTGNVGLRFTGTYAIDPALLTRAMTHTFSYLGPDDESAVAQARHPKASPDAIGLFVRFANEVRSLATQDEEMPTVSTREVLEATRLNAAGLEPSLAIRATVIESASQEGEGESPRARMEMLWTGIAGR